LRAYLDAYFSAVAIAGDNKGRFFPSMQSGTRLPGTPMTRLDLFQIIKRRGKAAALPCSPSAIHFDITIHLHNGGNAQSMRRPPRLTGDPGRPIATSGELPPDEGREKSKVLLD
jgi:hypothetical protein